ncbi:hypothetical protein ACFQ9X_16070 [Catenulispora yoronensis]
MASQAPAKDAPTRSGGLRGFVDTYQQWISLVMRILLAVMWFKYSVGKLGSPDSNAQSVREFGSCRSRWSPRSATRSPTSSWPWACC